MRFCSSCNRALERDCSTGVVKFRCICGVDVDGDAYDARIGGYTHGGAGDTGRYLNLIRTAALDQTNQQVMKNCTNCGVDHMTQIRVGTSEVIMYVCTCGHKEDGGENAVNTESTLLV